jgi:glycerophosphoryl diester phosphodiesterase
VRTIPDGKRLFIEIKTEKQIVPELKRVLKEAGKTPAQTPLIGFSYDAMRTAKAELPALKVFWLAKVEPDKETGVLKPTASELIEKTKAAELDGLDLGSSIALPAEYLEPIQAAGLELYVWTVNDPERARHYRRLGVLGITTDKPAALREALE